MTNNITVWFGSCSATDKRALQRVVKSSQNIIVSRHPSMEDIYKVWCLKRTTSIVKDSTQLLDCSAHYHLEEDSEVSEHGPQN